MKSMKEKKYYCMEFELVSPLAVGSGENVMTDKDIVLDSQGKPYIPGSAMAGVYRKLLSPETADMYFGKELNLDQDKGQGIKDEGGSEEEAELTERKEETELTESKEEAELTESKVVVYDANICSGNPYTTKRDMVALDEYKTAKPGAKFDFEILEPGVTFRTYIEENQKEGDQDIAQVILQAWSHGELTIGAKTRRGYGQVALKKVYQASFNMENDLDKWLKFDLYNQEDNCWSEWKQGGAEVLSKLPDASWGKERLHISLHLKQRGGISIRQYSTKENEPDYIQMKLADGTPVIPGTSWAGAFRAQMKKLGMTEEELGVCFGTMKKERGHRSLLSFTESKIRGGCDVRYSRNAIDRFTGGTIDGALYTENTYYNGHTELEITLEDMGVLDRALNEKIKHVMAAAIMDLHNGYMAVGGLTAIGRGLFEIESICINGHAVQGQEISYENITGLLGTISCLAGKEGKD